ncbi:CHAT domain-containing protein [Nostoc sphaeroides CCNUC1]|uniref:CHAT domain-containing protein n=2 Tax=Nostoc sphaeroides TaxID=446679 RepID=A0A5P8WFB0_9NOSO|nr:CHAT domain-containing protein [Nostoc sphaeroides CCNUC1]
MVGVFTPTCTSLKTTIDLLEKNLVNVRGTKDKRREINILVSLGQAYMAVGDNSKAIAPFEQASAIARELQDPQLETAVLQSQGKALGQISYSYFVQGDYAKTIQYSEQLRAIAREIKNPYFEVVALGLLANSYQITGTLPTRANASKLLLITTKVKNQRKNQDFTFDYFLSPKAIA